MTYDEAAALLRRVAAAETTYRDAEAIARLLGMPTLQQIYDLTDEDGWVE